MTRLKRGDYPRSILVSVFVILSQPLLAASEDKEWWNGEFVHDGATTCDTDSRVVYGQNSSKPWEGFCQYKRVQKVRGLDAVIIDMSCTQEGEAIGDERQMLVKSGQNRVTVFPDGRSLISCDGLDESASKAGEPKIAPQPAANNECDGEGMEWESSPDRVGSFQRLKFNSQSSGSEIFITQFSGEGKQQWTTVGEQTCSNGVSICRFHFTLASGQTVSLPYETIDLGTERAVVIPSLYQEVLLAERHNSQERQSGLQVIKSEGYVLGSSEDTMPLPNNLYRLSKCRSDYISNAP